MPYELRGVAQVYDGRTVLDVPQLDIERRRVYGLLGPNGAGKTTLLEILAFLKQPTRGALVYDGRQVDFSDRRLLRALRREVVLVPQTPIMFTTSVARNVEFGLKVRKMPADRRAAVVEEMLELVGLRDFAKARADRLSGGETQRAAIARAMACSPKVILFDEPTANVDVENQAAIEEIIRTINQERDVSVIFTTHNFLQAAKVADQNLFLFDGRPADSVYENIFTARIYSDGEGRWCLIHDKVRLPAPQVSVDGRVRVSVDPRRLFLAEAAEDGPGMEGRVIQVTAEDSAVRLLVDVGVALSVMLDEEDYRRRPWMVGETVRLRVAPDSVEII